MRHFELDARPGHGTVRVDGTDISSSITGVTVEARVNDVPRVTLDLRVFETARSDGQAEIIIPDPTRETLIALGWTPPEDNEDDGS